MSLLIAPKKFYADLPLIQKGVMSMTKGSKWCQMDPLDLAFIKFTKVMESSMLKTKLTNKSLI